MRQLPNALIGACVVATVARVAAVWSQLPPIMASHFDAAGTPDGAMPRGAFFTTLAFACGATVLLPVLAAVLLRHVPAGAINVPHRDYWLAPERRAESIDRLQRSIAWFPVPLAALFALVVELTLQANIQRTALNAGALWTGLGLFVVTLGLLIAKLHRQFGSPPSAPGRAGA